MRRGGQPGVADGLSGRLLGLDEQQAEDSASLPEPEVLAAEIAEDLEAALAEFAQIAAELKTR